MYNLILRYNSELNVDVAVALQLGAVQFLL
jgi:hypothetical protein